MEYNIVVPGLDPTGIAGDVTKAHLLTLVNNIQTADDIGQIIWSATAPDVVTYPMLARFRWGELSGSDPTGRFYYYNGTSWTLERPAAGTIDGDTLADGSVPISKLDATDSPAPYVVIRVNADQTAFEYSTVVDAIQNGTIGPEKLEAAPDENYIYISTAGGTFILQTFDDAFQTQLEASLWPYDQITAQGLPALANQVLYIATVNGVAAAGWADQLLRDNQVEVTKLKYPTGSAGKYPRVAAGETTFEFVSINTPKAAIVRATKAAGVAAQMITGTAGPVVVELDADADQIDPDGILSVASNQITLAAGTYLVDAYVPFYDDGTGTNHSIQLQLYNNTTTTVASQASTILIAGADTCEAVLKHVLVINTTTVLSLRVQTASTVGGNNLYLGKAVNVGGNREVYTQVSILKLA